MSSPPVIRSGEGVSGAMDDGGDEHDERAEVLQAMLKVAEDEIKSKDAQIELHKEMIAANEKV